MLYAASNNSATADDLRGRQTGRITVAMRSPTVRRFPWHGLERTSRSEVEAVRDVRAWAAAHLDMPRLTSVLGELLKAKVDVLLQGVRRSGGPGLAGGAAVLLARADAPELAQAMLVEVDMALAAAALMCVAKRQPPAVLQPGASASAQIAGGMAAIVMAALRRAHLGHVLRILSAGPAAALEADMARLGQDLLSVTLTVLLADDAYEARVVVPRSAVLGVASPRWDAAALAGLGVTPLSVPVVISAVRATTTDLASLQVGDAWMLGRPLTRGSDGAWVGPVLLAAHGASTGVTADLRQDGRIVLGGEVALVCAPDAEMETNMGDAKGEGGLIDTVGDVPVVVRAEIGEARMAAREWAALTRGDVLTLGRRVGESVVLRVGGVPVARGDLVEVDGEIGVRIVERIAQDMATK